ncbi:MAG TPA: hypothetical protein VGZ33_07415, partial [Acidimicrobiales bacterium]|nr:hypothetical protein [Acidimicrobiales bacterium]
CAAVDAANHVLTFRRARWSAPSTEGVAPPAVRGYNSVSCAAPTFCIAVDENGNGLLLGSGRASLHQVDATTVAKQLEAVPLTAVSCATSALCVAVDEEGNEITLTSRGAAQTWSRPGHVDPYRLTGVSCTRSGFCLAVDDDGGTVVYDHGRWFRPSRTVPLGAIDAVSCTGVASCAVAATSQVAIGTARG